MLILFILVYWSFRFLSLFPVWFPICAILLYCTLLLWSFEVFPLVVVFLLNFILFLLLIFFVKEPLRSEDFSLLAIYLLFWIGRDLIFLFFPLILSFSLFLVPEVVYSTFPFIELISVANNIVLLPLLMFPNIIFSKYDFCPPPRSYLVIFLIWWSVFGIRISTIIFFSVIITIGDVLIIFDIFLFWVCIDFFPCFFLWCLLSLYL